MRLLWSFLLLFPAAIFLVHAALLVGVLLARLRERWSRRAEAPPRRRISVIVVARDEEKTLPGLLESLAAQTVTEFQTVLVNDRSADRTPAIMEEFARRQRRPVTVLHNSASPVGANPKQVLLDRGVQAATGEVLFFTDADCLLPPRWLEDHLRAFRHPRVGVVFGQISMPPDGSFLARYQAFDQPLIHQYSSGSAGLGLPTGCFGNNLAARREAIESIGGFRRAGLHADRGCRAHRRRRQEGLEGAARLPAGDDDPHAAQGLLARLPPPARALELRRLLVGGPGHPARLPLHRAVPGGQPAGAALRPAACPGCWSSRSPPWSSIGLLGVLPGPVLRRPALGSISCAGSPTPCSSWASTRW